MTRAPGVDQPILGEIIEERREQLGLTKSEAARRAGISRSTWHEVEAGQRSNLLAGTLDAFDKALAFEPGTLRRAVRSGRQPTTAETPRRRLVATIEVWVTEP